MRFFTAHAQPRWTKKEIIMMRLFLPVLFLLLANTALAEQYSVEPQKFDGFEQCRVTKQLDEEIKKLITSEKPQNKEETVWTYAIKGNVFGLPAHAMLVGVCSATGERDCGWGSFVAVVVSKPLEEVKKHLKKQFGSDFTKEKREKEHNVTLRPVLAEAKKTGESILYCDPGDL